MSEINITESEFTREAVISRIREATSTLHMQLENTELSKNLMRPEAGVSAYVSYLVAMRSVIFISEQNVFSQVKSSVKDIEERYKTHLIDHDLMRLGANSSPTFIPALNGISTKINNEAKALGFLYVIEGSSLGGMYIAKHWKTKVDIDDALSFFSVYGKDTAKRWHSFLDYLTAYALTEERLDDICKGAVYAFESIHHHFETIAT